MEKKEIADKEKSEDKKIESKKTDNKVVKNEKEMSETQEKMSKKKIRIIAGSVLGVVVVATAITVPVVLLTGKNNHDPLEFLNTNMYVMNAFGTSVSDDEKIKEGSIYEGVLLGEQVSIPEEDINIEDEIKESVGETDLISFKFDSLYFNVSILADFGINDVFYTPVAISMGIENLYVNSLDYEFSIGSYDFSTYIFESNTPLNPSMDLEYDGGKINYGLTSNEYEYNDYSILNSKELKSVSSLYFEMLTLESIKLTDKNDPRNSIEYGYITSNYASVTSNGYAISIFNLLNTDSTKKITSIEYLFAEHFNIEIGKNKLNFNFVY